MWNILNLDRSFIVDSIKNMLDILNKEEQSVEIDNEYAYQIKEYLSLLDLIMEVDILHFPNTNNQDKKIIISQPGLRYAQAEALVNSLLLDQKFNALSVIERTQVIERALSAIKGRMIEDLVLLETKIAHPHKIVFQLQFAVGEFDMVIQDPQTLTCEIFEIKYSKEANEDQYKHLVNPEKCAQTEHRFGIITKKCVIYRGPSLETNGIQYLNIEEYLRAL